jgi:two-component system, NtrC family, response regulator
MTRIGKKDLYLENTVLIVDDDPSVIVSLSLLCKQAGLRSISASNQAEAIESLAKNSCACVLQDMNFSMETTGEEGLALLEQIKAQYPDIPLILMTAWASIDLAVQGVKQGAFDFVSKPWNNQQLLQTIKTAISLSDNKQIKENDNRELTRSDIEHKFDCSHIIGESKPLLRVLETISRVSQTDASVLILGESGTGKELIAEAIHRNSKRSDSPIVKVNLGGMNQNLFESEMFGHAKGAFTDAKSDRVGRFALAEGGTLFLDEMGDLDKPSQVKLLRVLQDKLYQPLGSSKNVYADVRVVSATNHDLEELVEQGEFREDLFYRINLITVKLPALRERPSDIPLIAQYLIEKIQQQYQLNKVNLDRTALKWLSAQTWPGNIRQLKQVLERVALVAGSDCLTQEHFELFADASSKQSNAIDANLTLEQIEVQAINQALEGCDGNISQAAEKLGLSRQALYRRMEKHHIEHGGQNDG